MSGEVFGNKGEFSCRPLAHQNLVWIRTKGHFAHETESPWPLHFKYTHWWKRRSRSKFVLDYAWGTNGVCECTMEVSLHGFLHGMLQIMSGEVSGNKGEFSYRSLAHQILVWIRTKGHFTHESESLWPLQFKHSHWWKRRSWSKIASYFAWGTNGVSECTMEAKSTWIPTWHVVNNV